MEKQKRLVIFGSAEIASLAKFYFDNDSSYKVVGFTVDDSYVTSQTFEGLPLVPFSEVVDTFSPSNHEMFVGLSYRNLNQQISTAAMEWMALPFSSRVGTRRGLFSASLAPVGSFFMYW